MVGEHDESGGASAPRRSTYVPPADDSLGEEDVIAENLPPLGSDVGPVATPIDDRPEEDGLLYPPAPSRQSLPPSAVLGHGDTSDTVAMMKRLEEQIELKRVEEEAFRGWADALRVSHPELCEAIIAHERAIFDGAERTEFRVETPEQEPGEAETEPPSSPDIEAVVELDPAGSTESKLSEDPRVEDTDAPGQSEPVAPAVDEPDVSELAPASTKPVRVPRPLSPTLWSLMSTWWIALIPAVALTFGLSVVAGGIEYSEALTAAAAAALIVGLVVAGLTRSRTPLRDTFGAVGGVIPGLLLLVLRLVVLVLLVWWSSGLASDIAVLSGLWPDSAEEAQILGAALIGASVVIHLFVSAPVLRVTLWGSATLGVLGAAALVVRTLPEVVAVPTWVLPSDAVAVASAVALVVAGGLALLAPITPTMAGLVAFKKVRAPRLWASVMAVLPIAALLGFVVVLAAGAPEFADALREDPVRTLAVGLGTWFPIPALLALVLPVVGVLAVGLAAATSSLRDMSVPGPHPLVASAIAVLFVAGIVASVVWSDIVSAALPDVVTTVGVALAAWAGVTAMNAALPARPSGQKPVRVRWGNLLGMASGIALGLGVVSSSVSWLSWQGYLVDFVTVEGLGVLTEGAIGVLLALVLGVLTALLSFVFAFASKGHSRVQR